MATNGHVPVAEGGLFHGYRATYSKDTQNLLKTMMQESRLTNFQQRQLDKAMKDGGTLPSACHPTSSAKPKKPQQKKVTSKVLNPKNYSAHSRTREEIEASGAYEREKFQPTPQTKFGGLYENDKRRLANMMAYGEDIKPRGTKPIEKEETFEDQKQTDRFNELEKEIEERRAFLGRMERLGKAGEHRTIVETEISQMVREMEVIDKRRDEELDRLIRERQKQSTSGT